MTRAQYEERCSRRFVEEVVILGGRRWRLPGVVTLPAAEPPVAGVVLVPGTGPQDRDASNGRLRPFRDLACGLASRQIAVLRYDKRTYAYPQVGVDDPTFTVKDEVIVDAVAALECLQSHPLVQTDALFLLGHSAGGALLPRIAVERPGIAGLIVLGGSPRPLAHVFLEQVEYWASTSPFVSDATLLRARRQAARALDTRLSLSTPPRDLPLGLPPAYWRDLQTYRPLDVIRCVATPLSVLHAGRDCRIFPRDLQAWVAGLRGRPDTTIREYPDLNHFFVESYGHMSLHEGLRPGHVARAVIDDIAEWIHQRCEAA